MLDRRSVYDPGCIVCGPVARCDCPWVEGCLVGIERVPANGSRGLGPGLVMHLATARGRHILFLDGRFAYLADGLAGAPDGVVLRAYHLHAVDPAMPPADRADDRPPARAGSRSPAAGFWPRLSAGPDSLVIVEPDWLVDVTALAGTDYCLRQWLSGRLAAHPPSLQMLRGTAVHACFTLLCRGGALTDADIATNLARHGPALDLAGVPYEALQQAVDPHVERLRAWFDREGDGLVRKAATTATFESTLLCPELGLRGRVDLALRRDSAVGRPSVSRIVELKTARYKAEWPDPEFQVRGYYAILASQQRLAADFDAVVLYTGGAVVEARPVSCGPSDVAHVVLNRNRAVIALLLGHAPPAGGNRCRRSSGRSDCVLLSRLLALDDCHGRDLVDAAAAEDQGDARFYPEYYRLLRLEQQATGRELATIWRLLPADRVHAGTALDGLALSSSQQDAEGRWCYRLACHNQSELRPGDSVLVSDGDPIRGDVVIATLTVVGETCVEVVSPEPVACPVLIDRYLSGEALDRTVRGLHAWLGAPARVRALLYGRVPPAPAGPAAHDGAGPNGAREGLAAGLNAQQVLALDLALRAPDYLLVQGPPGTGKTHLIATMVRALVARGERVGLSAWTNQAVDTLLQALLDQGFSQIIRLGTLRNADPALECLAARGASVPRDAPVVAGTISTLADPGYSMDSLARTVLILDEAAQVSVAAAVGALRLAGRFILVGDDQQLPPVVQSEEAAREGLSLSPFSLLRPEAQAAGVFVRLSVQYRMHSAIGAWPSDAFYAGALVADPGVACRELPPAAGPVRSPITERSVPLVVVDTAGQAGREALFAARAVQALVLSGVPAAAIGVVAPFRARVAAVRRVLERDEQCAACVVDTVDRFQGGQREAMVVCLGLDGASRRGHAFVDDPRRLNVAFTRARAKLIVIGDLAAARSLPTLAGFLHHCSERGVPVLDMRRPASS